MKSLHVELHPDKTKILTNISQRRGRNARSTVDIAGKKVDVLKYSDNTKYLGRKLTYDNYHKTEVENRIASAWRKFNVLRHELTSRSYSLTSRLKLFDTTATTHDLVWKQQLDSSQRLGASSQTDAATNAPAHHRNPPTTNATT